MLLASRQLWHAYCIFLTGHLPQVLHVMELFIKHKQIKMFRKQ
jgi:hypothetical protein